MAVRVNTERLKREFAELVGIDSPSFGERQMADRVKEKLREIGFSVLEDNAAELISGGRAAGAGNLYGYLEGELPGEPILLSAHLDTVQPAIGKQAVFHEDGTITSRGDTVLGSDDLAGLTEILEGVRCLREAGIAHRAVEILFPVAEEAYAEGSAVFDYGRIRAKEAYVLDLSGPVGTAAVQAPSILSFEVTITGRASHAGFAPEEGVHAIAVMSEAISRIRQGRIGAEAAGGEEVTLNIGLISGGRATNIVPERCTCRGEIRSYSHQRALETADQTVRTFREAASRAGAACEAAVTVNVTAYQTGRDTPVVRNFLNACRKLSLDGTLTRTFGGSDNNSFALHGISGIVLSCGMCEVHSVREYTKVEYLETGAKLVAELLSCPAE